MLIIVFSLNLGWLPSGGMGSWKNYIMPAITLGTGDAALDLSYDTFFHA